jgi:hypothetical protein
MNIYNILNKFPKQRAELPKAYQEVYKKHYLINRQGQSKATSLSQKMEIWLHKKVANDTLTHSIAQETLEIGAGTLNQLKYERCITSYDIIEPFSELYSDSIELSKIRHIYQDIKDIDPAIKYDRIISIATFEHILNLPYVIAKSSLLLKTDGKLRISIPNEGTLLWKLGTMYTGREYKKMYGLNYDLLMKYEHVNSAKEIELLLRYFFNNVQTEVFGISRSIAFYRFFNCTHPNLRNVEEYLKSIE